MIYSWYRWFTRKYGSSMAFELLFHMILGVLGAVSRLLWPEFSPVELCGTHGDSLQGHWHLHLEHGGRPEEVREVLPHIQGLSPIVHPLLLDFPPCSMAFSLFLLFVSLDFHGFPWMFYDFLRLSIDVHGFSWRFHWFSRRGIQSLAPVTFTACAADHMKSAWWHRSFAKAQATMARCLEVYEAFNVKKWFWIHIFLYIGPIEHI